MCSSDATYPVDRHREFLAEEWRDLDPSRIKLDTLATSREIEEFEFFDISAVIDPINPFARILDSGPRINFSEFEIKRHFEYEDPDFAHRIMALPSYSVTFTPYNITAVTFPCHDHG
jgi:hypothetical protein